jgi:hypothetical protein
MRVLWESKDFEPGTQGRRLTLRSILITKLKNLYFLRHAEPSDLLSAALDDNIPA